MKKYALPESCVSITPKLAVDIGHNMSRAQRIQCWRSKAFSQLKLWCTQCRASGGSHYWYNGCAFQLRLRICSSVIVTRALPRQLSTSSPVLQPHQFFAFCISSDSLLALFVQGALPTGRKYTELPAQAITTASATPRISHRAPCLATKRDEQPGPQLLRIPQE